MPLEAELLVQADRLVGGDGTVLVIDDMALPKKRSHSEASQLCLSVRQDGELPDVGFGDTGAW